MSEECPSLWDFVLLDRLVLPATPRGAMRGKESSAKTACALLPLSVNAEEEEKGEKHKQATSAAKVLCKTGYQLMAAVCLTPSGRACMKLASPSSPGRPWPGSCSSG